VKRRRVTEYGQLRRTDGSVFTVKDKAVAQALEDGQRRIKALERVVKDGERWGQRHTLALAALQNHWWVRLGEALRLVRPKG